MSKRPLDSLLRLRKREQEEAERHFSDVLASEARAARAVAEAEEALLTEQRKAADPDCDDTAVESFARWLPHGREILSAARSRAHEVSLDTAYARSALAIAQASVKAVETIIEERQRSEMILRARRDQQHLDDVRPTVEVL